MIKVALFDQKGTHFATLDMLEFPRVSDTIEFSLPDAPSARVFNVKQVVHKMIQLPAYETMYVEGVAVPCRNDPPWRWEFQLHGDLQVKFGDDPGPR